MKLEKKTTRNILNASIEVHASIEGKTFITKSDWLEKNESKKWVSVESVKQYIRNLETSNQMYGKTAQELFDDLVDELDEKYFNISKGRIERAKKQ